MVFTTKNREPFIEYSLEKNIYNYLRDQLKELECPAIMINGMPDHVHILYFQHPKIAVSNVAKQIKGSSSFWINNESLVEGQFAWQTGYSVFSVSAAQIQTVQNYIMNQKKHHSKITFKQEVEEFQQLYKLK